ncbi:MAG TPA: multicopper oxidase domain-containing protein [Burkholderiales bacterium]|nr:multicopper oxidase domain-containing protein [Burkholderiales bacterium]
MSTQDSSGNDRKSKRRTFLKIGGAAGLTGAVGGTAVLTSLFPRVGRTQARHHHRTPVQTNTAAQQGLAKFVDPLPIPSTIAPSGTLNGVPFYDVKMRPLQKKLHRDLPATALWGYNGQYPAPTFEVRRGKPIAVKWENQLPGTHFLPIDQTIHGAEPPTPTVRTVVHLHGMKSMPASDGYPEAWFTNGFQKTGPFFETQVYRYPNDQQATTLWYHDHALGITRLNVYAGLGGGFYLIRDAHEDSLGLPSGRFEIPLVIQDRFLNTDGSLLYPVEDNGGDPDPRVPPVWIPEFFGDTVLVNGKVWPFLEVEPRKYRFRILNGSNARFYHMTLQEAWASGQAIGGRSGPVFTQIGSDGGLLPAPVKRTDLLVAPAERLDVVIDFSGLDGKSFLLTNDAKAPYPDGDDIVPTEVMLFKVNQRLSSRDTSRVPSTLNSVPLINPANAVKMRDLVLSELDSATPFENPIIAMINDAHWDDPITETPKAGSTEVWRIINTTGDAHPIHVHLVQFQIIDRRLFDPEQYPGNLVYTAPAETPGRDERPAWKDTVISLPGTVTRIIAKFDLPAEANPRPGDKFLYVYHCHILEHEENEMMRPYVVVA